MLIYANIKAPTATEPTAHLFYSWTEFYTATFSPLTEYEAVELKASGKTYRERKTSVEAVAIEFSNIANCGGLYWSDLITLSDWFYRFGKRYGLLAEFRENGLC